MKKTIITLIIFIYAVSIFADDDFGIKFKGFVRTDMIFDSRRSVALRESAIMLYPLPEKLNIDDKDIYASPQLTMLVLHTRLNGMISGPDAFGAKTEARIEGEFFGANDPDANGFRLRHGYIKLKWPKFEILAGQYWNPNFIIGVLPNFNFASPFIPYGRGPQLRLKYKSGNFSVQTTASMQSDFRSIGPLSQASHNRSTEYIKNAAIPSLNLNLKYDDGDAIVGAGFDYKTLEPDFDDNLGLMGETVTGFSYHVFGKYSVAGITAKLQAMIGQNLPDLIMIGGYCLNEEKTGFEPINNFSSWAELSYGKKIMFNLLAGYTQNLGTDLPVSMESNNIYAMGANIEDIFRVAPSIVFSSGRMRVIGEMDYTIANYGDFANNKLEYENLKSYSNLRFSLVAMYLF